MATTTLTRVDLAKFLPNQRAVKAFESLLETSSDGGIALAKANAALNAANAAQTTADAAQTTATAAQVTATTAATDSDFAPFLSLAPPVV